MSGIRSMRLWVKALLVILLVGIIVLFLRAPILRGVGNVLIHQDPPVHADAIYALGGASFDRGGAAAELWRSGYAPLVYCTGSNIPQSYLAEGRTTTEADLTRSAAIHHGADPRYVLPFRYGTSTREEAMGILRHAQRSGMDTIMVITTEFHTRRVRSVFADRSSGSGIHVCVQGTISSEYDPRTWWQSEEGLLMVNNEYVKTLYYALAY